MGKNSTMDVKLDGEKQRWLMNSTQRPRRSEESFALWSIEMCRYGLGVEDPWCNLLGRLAGPAGAEIFRRALVFPISLFGVLRRF